MRRRGEWPKDPKSGLLEISHQVCPHACTSENLDQLTWPVSWACSETAEVWVRASRISLSCSLFLSCMDLPVSRDADFAALTGNPVDNAILFNRVDGALLVALSVIEVS